MRRAMDAGRTVERVRRAESEQDVLTECFQVQDPWGFHSRPAALFVRAAEQYDAQITVAKGGARSVNGKSVMALLMLRILRGDTLTITAHGFDAPQAMSAIEQFFAAPLDGPSSA